MEPILLDFPNEYISENLYLRSYESGDGKEYYELLQSNKTHLEEEVGEIKELTSIEKSERFCRNKKIEWLMRKRLVSIILKKDTNEMIGQIWIEPISWQNRIFEIGYFISKKFEGQGLVTEAVHASIEFLKENVKATRIEIRSKAGNIRSWAVAERCGFTKEGQLRERAVTNDGIKDDLVIYGLLLK